MGDISKHITEVTKVLVRGGHAYNVRTKDGNGYKKTLTDGDKNRSCNYSKKEYSK